MLTINTHNRGKGQQPELLYDSASLRMLIAQHVAEAWQRLARKLMLHEQTHTLLSCISKSPTCKCM